MTNTLAYHDGLSRLSLYSLPWPHKTKTFCLSLIFPSKD